MLTLLNELVKTATARAELARRQREVRLLQKEFPPRAGSSPFWPAAALLLIGALAVTLSVRARHRPLPVEAAHDGVPLSVLSEPLGAHVVATWPGGSRESVTPFVLRVPRGTPVRFSYSQRDTSAPYVVEVRGDAPQSVTARLPSRSLELGPFE